MSNIGENKTKNKTNMGRKLVCIWRCIKCGQFCDTTYYMLHMHLVKKQNKYNLDFRVDKWWMVAETKKTIYTYIQLFFFSFPHFISIYWIECHWLAIKCKRNEKRKVLILFNIKTILSVHTPFFTSRKSNLRCYCELGFQNDIHN